MNTRKRYESTQSYSPTFTAFNRKLAAGLIERYDLRGKTVVEIGCGQGEFLVLLNELGDNRGIGFDPAYDGRLPESVGNPDLTFITDFYTEKQTGYKGDFFCCKMTLEHISNTGEFMRTVRRAIGEQLDTTVFFQIPNGGYVLKDLAFWDIYYEHCSYFTAGSLRYLFENNGFEVLDTFTDYNDQYLMIEARPIAPAAGRDRSVAGAAGRYRQACRLFCRQCAGEAGILATQAGRLPCRWPTCSHLGFRVQGRRLSDDTQADR